MKRPAGVAVLLLLAGLSVSAEPAAPASQQTSPAQSSSTTQAPSPTFKLGVDYVEVDARVTDKQGNFARGLTRDDFQIFEDGKRQTVSAFSVVDMPTTAPAPVPLKAKPFIHPDVASNAEPFTGRLYVMLIDDLHTDPTLAQRTRDAARRFVEQDLGPADLMAVVHTGGSLEGSQPFTSDKALLLAAIERTGGLSMGSATLALQHEENGMPSTSNRSPTPAPRTRRCGRWRNGSARTCRTAGRPSSS